MKEGGGGREEKKRLQTNPSILKTHVRQRTQHLIGSASQTILTCVDQRFHTERSCRVYLFVEGRGFHVEGEGTMSRVEGNIFFSKNFFF